jgi:hypothetical protein
MVKLLLDLKRAGNGAGDFFAQQLTIPLVQPLHFSAQRRFSNLQFHRQKRGLSTQEPTSAYLAPGCAANAALTQDLFSKAQRQLRALGTAKGCRAETAKNRRAFDWGSS